MTLLYDHEPFTRANGAHEFGPRSIGDDKTRMEIRFGRCTTAAPTLWPNASCEIAAMLWIAINGGPPLGSGGIGFISDDALALFNSGTTAAQLIAQGKLQFGAQGGIYVRRGGAEAAETTLRCDLPPGINRVVTGVLGVKGGPLVTQLTLEVT